MIKHIVMWKLKEEACGKTRDYNALKMKELLEGLMGKINELKSIKVGINHKCASESNFHVVLEVEVENFKDLSNYANNPLHLEVVKFIKLVSNERIAIDYETE